MVGLNAWTARKPVIYVLWFSTVLAGFRMFIGCDQLKFRGYISETENFDWKENCNCKEGKFDPVCDKMETSKAYKMLKKKHRTHEKSIFFYQIFNSIFNCFHTKFVYHKRNPYYLETSLQQF